jgi:hypothetical protein
MLLHDTSGHTVSLRAKESNQASSKYKPVTSTLPNCLQVATSLLQTLNYARQALGLSVRIPKVIHRISVTHQTATS